MRRRFSYLLVLVLAAPLVCVWLTSPSGSSAPARAADPAPAADEFGKVAGPFLTKHCTSCHGEKAKKGDLVLTVYRDEASVLKDRKRWEAAVKMVQTGEMPPSTRRRPDPAEAAAFLKTVRGVFERHDRTAKRDPGHVTVRRLNRTEYNNTIRDLVGVDFNAAEDFPADDVGYGFDNIGDVLSLSPLLFERYLAAAEAVVERAVLTEQPPPPKRPVTPNFFQPRAGRPDNGVRSLFLKDDALSTYTLHLIDDGDYIVRVRAAALPDGAAPVRFAVLDNDTEIKTFEVKTATPFAQGKPPPPFEVRLPLKKGEHVIKVKLLDGFPPREKLGPPKEQPDESAKKEAKPMRGGFPRLPGLHVRLIEVEGPLDYWPETHRRVMTCAPGKTRPEQTREILTRFASKAFRRPATADEIDRLVKLVDGATARGDKWESAIQLALQAVLVSPKFLFRVELDDRPDSKDAHPIDDYALAARLSYFLWNTMPDDELFALAAKKQLAANLDAQVKRMLADPKAKTLCDSFAAQWLQLRNLSTMTPDPKLFPNFTERLRAAMLKETELFFEAVVKEDRSVLDLIDADFTFLNGVLAKHYGVDGVYGDRFRRVPLTDGKRGGVLTQASILTVTSNPTRTSPVKRGKWVMEQILGTPPPEPPPDVPELPADEKAQLTGSLRQRMEQHRANPNCAVCHEQMDAMGFAFENFDAVGAFRARDGNFPIDPSGSLPGGLRFKGPGELKTILKGKKDLFGRCLAEKMLTYALGRGLEYYDRPAVDAIVAALARNDYRFSTLVGAIVKSDPFRLRRGKQ